MNEYIKQIIAHSDLFVSGVVGFVILVGLIIEALPIPINPLRWIGNRLNQDLQKEVENVKKDINELDGRLDKIEYDNLKKNLEDKRVIVLNFADKIRRTEEEKLGIEQCTFEDFKNIINVMDDYHKLIVQNKIDNGAFDSAKAYIISTFDDLSRKGRFVDYKSFKKTF